MICHKFGIKNFYLLWTRCCALFLCAYPEVLRSQICNWYKNKNKMWIIRKKLNLRQNQHLFWYQIGLHRNSLLSLTILARDAFVLRWNVRSLVFFQQEIRFPCFAADFTLESLLINGSMKRDVLTKSRHYRFLSKFKLELLKKKGVKKKLGSQKNYLKKKFKQKCPKIWTNLRSDLRGKSLSHKWHRYSSGFWWYWRCSLICRNDLNFLRQHVR